MVSVGGGVKGGLTKLSGEVVRIGIFDITKQKDGNDSIASEREMVVRTLIIVLTADGKNALLWKRRVGKGRERSEKVAPTGAI